jgi:hypothetical protein
LQQAVLQPGDPEITEGETDAAILCAKVHDAFHSPDSNETILNNAILEFSRAISELHPPEILGFLECDVLGIMFWCISTSNSFRLRTSACNFFVVITSYRWSLSRVFQTVPFCTEFTQFLNSSIPNQEDLNLVLTVVRNILSHLDPETHNFILSQTPIDRLIALATNTSNGRVVISVLDCGLQFSKLPLPSAISNELLVLITTIHKRSAGIDAIAATSLWTFYHLIENDSVDFAEFERLRCVDLVQKGLCARARSILVAACRVVSVLDETFAFDVARIVQLVEGEVSAAATAALRSIVLSQRKVALDLVSQGYFLRCFDVFERSDVLTKVGMIGVVEGLIDVMEADGFAAAISPLGENGRSVFGMISELCLTGDSETVASCFELLVKVFRRAVRCGIEEVVRDGMRAHFALDWLNGAAVENPAILAVLAEIFPVDESPSG